MKIAINLLPYSSYQGIEVFAENLMRALARNFPAVKFILIVHQNSPAFTHFSAPNVQREIIHVCSTGKIMLALVQQTALRRVLRRTQPDVLLSFSPSFPLWYGRNIVVIHDCAYDRFNEAADIFSRLYFKLMFIAAKYFARRILTVSAFSQKELEQLYGISAERIRVISEGVPAMAAAFDQRATETLQRFGISMPYFLYIGNMRPRKNVVGMVDAFKLFCTHHPDYQFVLAGKYDTRFIDIKKYIVQQGLHQTVLPIGFIEGGEKTVLYKNAAALLFVSFYEGFGLPVLEAQALGVPVLTANSSSLPEVGGRGALYADPYSVTDIAQKMDQIVSDESLRERIVHEGFINVQKFSWDSAAQQCMAAIQQAYENTPNK